MKKSHSPDVLRTLNLWSAFQLLVWRKDGKDRQGQPGQDRQRPGACSITRSTMSNDSLPVIGNAVASRTAW